MPERRPLLRRAAYLAAVTTTVGVFAGSLAGIASTQGQAKPNGDAAALARKLQHREDVRFGHHCHHGPIQPAQPTSQRAVEAGALISPAASRGRAARSPDRARDRRRSPPSPARARSTR
jgi:hypothetical protein